MDETHNYFSQFNGLGTEQQQARFIKGWNAEQPCSDLPRVFAAVEVHRGSGQLGQQGF